MIVDDEPDVLIALKTILERQNYDVITVTNGVECLKEIEKGFTGVILMDIMMPVMDGWETINQIVKKGYTKDNIQLLHKDVNRMKNSFDQNYFIEICKLISQARP